MRVMSILQHHFDMFGEYVDATGTLGSMCRLNNSSLTIVQFAEKATSKEAHTDEEDDFRVTGKQLDRMTGMILGLSSGKVLIVKELATEFDVSVRTIHEDLRRLEKWDIVKFEGAPKTGKYVLTENGKLLLEGAGQDE